MKHLAAALVLSFTVSSAFAAKLDDVSVLDLKATKNSFKVKAQVSGGPKDSYFFIDIVKEDEKSFEKLALVLLKLKQKQAFRLNIEIPSFSVKPSGSYYRSETVTFTGSALDESLVP